jgi:ribonuclease HI
LPESEVYAYTDGASTGSRGPGGYEVVISWKDKTEEISGGEQNTTNLRMEITAAYVALERIDEGHKVTIYSDASYLVNCMRRGWYKKWRENRWLTYRKEPVANRDPMRETPSSDAASPRGAMEEGQGALQDPRITQDRQRPG